MFSSKVTLPEQAMSDQKKVKKKVRATRPTIFYIRVETRYLCTIFLGTSSRKAWKHPQDLITQITLLSSV